MKTHLARRIVSPAAADHSAAGCITQANNMPQVDYESMSYTTTTTTSSNQLDNTAGGWHAMAKK